RKCRPDVAACIRTRSLLPFRFGRKSFAGPLRKRRGFEKADVRNGLVLLARGGMQTGEVANHPLAVVQLPVKRRAPLLVIYCRPAFGEPPAEVLIAAVVDEFEKVAVADRGFVERVVPEEDLVRRLLVIKCEVVGTRSARVVIAQPEQPAFDFRDAFNP